jgi:predicted HTH domain antitoxin
MLNGHTNSFTVEVPDEAGLTEQSLKEYLAAKLYGDGTLSLGQAASMAGTDKWGFPKILTRFGVPFFNYNVEDFEKEYRFQMSK